MIGGGGQRRRRVQQHVRVRLQRIRPLRAAALAGLLAISGLLVTARDPGTPAGAAAQTSDPVADRTHLVEARLAEAGYFVDCPRADGALAATPAAGGRTGRPGCRFRAIDPTGGRDRVCGVTVHLLVPECGAWFGIYTKPAGTDWAGAVTNVEQQIHHRFDLVSRYHWWTDILPDTHERRLAADGRYLRINIRSTDAAGHALRWAAIAGGAEDAAIDRHAAALAALGTPVFLSFDQAPELQVDTTSGTPPTSSPLGAICTTGSPRSALPTSSGCGRSPALSSTRTAGPRCTRGIPTSTGSAGLPTTSRAARTDRRNPSTRSSLRWTTG